MLQKTYMHASISTFVCTCVTLLRIKYITITYMYKLPTCIYASPCEFLWFNDKITKNLQKECMHVLNHNWSCMHI